MAPSLKQSSPMVEELKLKSKFEEFRYLHDIEIQPHRSQDPFMFNFYNLWKNATSVFCFQISVWGWKDYPEEFGVEESHIRRFHIYFYVCGG